MFGVKVFLWEKASDIDIIFKSLPLHPGIKSLSHNQIFCENECLFSDINHYLGFFLLGF